MSQTSNTQKSGSNLGASLIILVIGFACIYFEYSFLAWFLFAIATYGFAEAVLPSLTEQDKSQNIAGALALIIIGVGIYINLDTESSTWSRIASWILIAIIIVFVVFAISSFIKIVKFRVFIKVMALFTFSILLCFIFDGFSQKIFPTNVILIYMSVDTLRRGLYELIVSEKSLPNEDLSFIIPDLITISLLVFGIYFYVDMLFFHMIAVSLVLSLFRFSTERFIPEVAVRERQKIDDEQPKDMRNISSSLFVSLAGTHYGVNLLILPLLIVFMYLPISESLLSSDVQSNVFQVSIGLIGIVVAFSTLILSERLKRSDSGWTRQTYLLRGLLGITFLFIIIAMVSFLGVTLKDTVQVTTILSVDDLVKSFLIDRDIQLRAIIALINEFVFFAVPAALLYFFSLNRDVLERFDREAGEE